MRRKKKDMITYYRTVLADSQEAAEQEGLARVLQAILPDTMDEWDVNATLIFKGNPRMGQLDKWDVRVDFHRIRRDKETRGVTRG